MTNLESKKFSVKETERKILLREFEKVAKRVTPPSSSLRGLKFILGEWISLRSTELMQITGYNQKKISLLNKKEIILNIGSFNNTREIYVNSDLVPIGGLCSMLKLIFGIKQIDHELFLNITFRDRHLSNIANGIILSHVLEHIHPLLAIKALKNCFYYLKPSGCIRVSVPYLGTYEKSNFPQCQEVYDRMLAKNRLIYDYGHQFMYNPELLTLVMEEAGFSEVKEVTFGKDLLGETDLLIHKPESIYLTGVKA